MHARQAHSKSTQTHTLTMHTQEERDGGGGLCSSQSGPEHVCHVSVGAVNPQHQREGEGHKGPGDALHASKQGAAFAAGLLQLFTRVVLHVVPGCQLQDLVQQEDGQGELQHHQPLG